MHRAQQGLQQPSRLNWSPSGSCIPLRTTFLRVARRAQPQLFEQTLQVTHERGAVLDDSPGDEHIPLLGQPGDRQLERELVLEPRLAHACQKGWGEFMSEALDAAGGKSPDAQWLTLQPILAELESLDRQPEPGTADAAPPSVWNRGRPRRIVRLRPHLLMRRESCRDGYLLRFTGREATSQLLDLVIEDIERMYAPAGPRSH